MSDIAIQVENLSKAYRIGLKEQQHETMLSAMVAWAKSPFDNFRNLRRLSRFDDGEEASEDIFWALKNVSFEIKHGEAIGIIGRNGAGKSTMLKILSRITEPTIGRAKIFGRVASLLEVGTGFHPDLTGRENVYLNGTVLGMLKREIDSKFDEIVAFSGVEKFIDTPVKRYSSGMRVRLAFSVAAHLEPEILIIDEVLAVGDAEFQRRCLGKMEAVAKQGRTVLFVSHNMSAIQLLCTRCLVLQQGKLTAQGETTEVVGNYLKEVDSAAAVEIADRVDRRGAGAVRVSHVEVASDDAAASSVLVTGGPVRFTFTLSPARPNVTCAFTIYDSMGQPLTSFSNDRAMEMDRVKSAAASTIVFHVDELLLVPGRYRINVAIYANKVLQDHVEGATTFDVNPGAVRGRLISNDSGFGRIQLPFSWEACD